MNNYLQIHPADNLLVALQKLPKGTVIYHRDEQIELVEDIPAKHKFALQALLPGDEAFMYGVLVGKAVVPIEKGAWVSTKNLAHAASPFNLGSRKTAWQAPDVSRYAGKHFMGYHRSNGSVGTANHWLVTPLVFCENRNVSVLKDALEEALGYRSVSHYRLFAQQLVSLVQSGAPVQEALEKSSMDDAAKDATDYRIFKNIDGVKFLTHEMGCGGTRSDAQALCGLLAGYIAHPNVAGATVLSLGCQNAQVALLDEEIKRRDPNFDKPLIVLEQQMEGTEKELMEKALKRTIAALQPVQWGCRWVYPGLW